MNPDTHSYYMPYDSENDTGDDTDGDTVNDTEGNTDNDTDGDTVEDTGSDTDSHYDARYALIRDAGPNFNTSQQQLKYMENTPGAQYDTNTDIKSLQNLVYLNPPKTTQTSLFSIKSGNRDKSVYTSPFNFTIKTPRVYKNITKFQLVQLSFPNNVTAFTSSDEFLSTFVTELELVGVPPECISTCVNTINCGTIANSFGVAEQGRTTASGMQMLTTLTVPNGRYEYTDIAKELTVQSNNTPPFNLISYNDFKETFKHSRDISALFNEPGDNFHSNLTPQRHGTHSKETIMNTYYTQQHIDSHPIITDTIAFNAYYYPILKHLVATNRWQPFLDRIGFSSEDIIDNVLKTFLGLDSGVYYNLCYANKGLLDNFRHHHTFKLKNINKYNWSYNDNVKQFNCIHDTLHTSITRDINNSFNRFLGHELTISNLTHNSFKTLKTSQVNYNTVFKHLEQELSTQLSIDGWGIYQGYFGGDFHSTNLGSWHYNTDLHNDIIPPLFTLSFNYTSTFGRQYGNYAGVNLTFGNFIDYHSTISSYYTLTHSTLSTISSIHGVSYDRHHQYISTKYTDVFPTHMITNKSYNTSNPLAASFIGNKMVYTPGQSVIKDASADECNDICCAIIERIVNNYYSCLPINSYINTLVYRLGLTNLTLTDFNLYSTITNATGAGNINFFLQINQDQSFNNMDIAMNENYNVSNETTGQVKLMSAKILTAGIGAGEITQTVIQNPILFENTLGKLDKLEFKIYADDTALTPMWLWTPFQGAFDEWDATFQIDEEVGYANRDTGWGQRPTIPIPNNPDGMQWLSLTSANNPNNK